MSCSHVKSILQNYPALLYLQEFWGLWHQPGCQWLTVVNSRYDKQSQKLFLNEISLYYIITWRLFSLVDKDIHKRTKPPRTEVLKQTQDNSELESKVLLLSFLSSMVAQMAKHLPTMRETWVQSLGWEDLLEKEMATHSSILAWKIPWTEEPGRLQSMGSQRVGYDWATSLHRCRRIWFNLLLGT